MDAMRFDSRWVLVTGASSGLGREIARNLAGRGAHLVLTARRTDRLEALAAELKEAHGTESRCIGADLSQPGAPDELFAEATAGHPLYAAVLNAGVTYFGRHRDLDPARFQTLLSTNVTSVVRLADLAVPHFVEGGLGGGLMLVASLAGVVPTAYQTAYSASKAFVIAFGRGLHHELEDENVSVTTFIPGGIDTEMGDHSGLARTWSADSMQIQAADECAREAVQAMADRRYLHVPGALNRVQIFFSRFLPQRLLGSQVAREYRKALAKVENHQG